MLTRADLRWLLNAVHPAPGPLSALDPARQRAVAALASRHRLGALLASRTGSAGFVPEVAAPLREHAAFVATRSLGFTRELVAIIQAAQREGILLVPFKGPLLALQAYGSLALREFDDLDLLTAREHLPAAGRLLEGLGYRLVHTGSHGADALSLRTEYHFPFQHPETGCCVELHAEVAPAGFAKPSWRQLYGQLDVASLGGASLPILGAADLVLVLCVHATKHLWGSLEFVAALAHLLHRHPPDWPGLERRARAFGVEPFLARGLSLIREWLPIPLPQGTPRPVRPDPAIADAWLAPPTTPAILRRPAFHLRAHESWPGKLKYAAGAVLAPNWDDFRWLPLPRRLQFFYPLVRLMRLATVHTPVLLRSVPRGRR